MSKPENIARAKSSFAVPLPAECITPETEALRSAVLGDLARNVKMGPFTATSGMILPYYLNATTNFLDKVAAPRIAKLMVHYLETLIRPYVQSLPSSSSEPTICLGMEVAGGVLASQLAAADNSSLNEWLDYLYIRKERKKTGTAQQLEGPQKYTSRTPTSPLAYAVWVDDALSTGSSLVDGVRMLKEDYNIQVVAALYLVDRSSDRAKLDEAKQHLASSTMESIRIFAPFDLKDVDAIVPKPAAPSSSS